MTAAVYRNTPAPSLSIPQTQNTAPVLEFNCLYTHDVRRKQKRWQDGFLRFHTFNKRVMVYDVPRNFIGDMHWNGEESLQEGDEVTLQQEGVLVQVAENVGKTETDLSGLRKKNRQGDASSSSPMRGATPVRLPMGSAISARGRSSIAQSAPTHLKHRSLNALLGAPRGPIGKATLPTKSPFDQRRDNEENKEWENGRPSKRRRPEARGGSVAQHNISTAKPVKEASLQLAKSYARMDKGPVSQREAQRADPEQAIDLTDDYGSDSELLFPDISSSEPVATSSPLHTTNSGSLHQIIVPPKPNLPIIQSRTTSVDDVSKKSANPNGKVLDVEPATTASAGGEDRHRDGEASCVSAVHRPDRKASTTPSHGRVLRLTAQPAKKNKLLCQAQLSSKSRSRVSVGEEDNTGVFMEEAEGGSTSERTRDHPTDIRLQYEKRLARISAKAEARRDAPLAIDAVPVEPEVQRTKESTRNPKKVTRKDVLAAAASAGSKEEQALPVGTDTGPTMDAMVQSNGKDAPETPDQVLASEHAHMSVSKATMVTSSSCKSPISAQQKRTTGAPVRYTRSFGKGPAETESHHEHSVGDPAKSTSATRPAQAATGKTTNGLEASPHNQQVQSRRRSPRKLPKPATANLDMRSEGTARVILQRAYQPPMPPKSRAQKQDVAEQSTGSGPWSREAFDLFEWRPPEWNEQNWCVGRANISC